MVFLFPLFGLESLPVGFERPCFEEIDGPLMRLWRFFFFRSTASLSAAGDDWCGRARDTPFYLSLPTTRFCSALRRRLRKPAQLSELPLSTLLLFSAGNASVAPPRLYNADFLCQNKCNSTLCVFYVYWCVWSDFSLRCLLACLHCLHCICSVGFFRVSLFFFQVCCAVLSVMDHRI